MEEHDVTQPSEESIRAACEEAGIIAGDAEGNAWRAVTALARRIEAEREAVPVATYWDHPGGTRTQPCFVPEDAASRAGYLATGYVERCLYTRPPKEPTI